MSDNGVNTVEDIPQLDIISWSLIKKTIPLVRNYFTNLSWHHVILVKENKQNRTYTFYSFPCIICKLYVSFMFIYSCMYVYVCVHGYMYIFVYLGSLTILPSLYSILQSDAPRPMHSGILCTIYFVFDWCCLRMTDFHYAISFIQVQGLM